MKIVAKSLVRDQHGNMLLLRRSRTHPNFPGHFDFPGGEVEPNESQTKAAQREIREETGLDIPLKQFQKAHSKQLSDDVLHVIFLVDLFNNTPSVELSWEHDRYEWMSKRQFLDLALPKTIDDYHLTVLGYLNQHL